MEIRLLGPVELVGAGGQVVPLAGNKLRGLLAVLALEAGQTVTPERLIDTLWGEQEVNSVNVVHVLVSKLRRACADAGEANVVRTQAGGYGLDLPPDKQQRLREIHCGDFTGMNRADIQARYGDLLHRWAYHPATMRLPGGETLVRWYVVSAPAIVVGLGLRQRSAELKSSGTSGLAAAVPTATAPVPGEDEQPVEASR